MPTADHASVSRPGLAFAIAAYGLWGILPVYFIALEPTGPIEIVAWRVLLSLAFCALLITVTRAWRPFIALVRDRRVLFTMGLAGVLIFVNWSTYVYATLTNQVVEAALGYFINPIVTVFLGVLVLRERLNATQWVAVGISIVAVIVRRDDALTEPAVLRHCRRRLEDFKVPQRVQFVAALPKTETGKVQRRALAPPPD